MASTATGPVPAGSLGFVLGATYPFRGLAFLLRRPRMWPWAVAPLVLTMLAIGVAFLVAMTGTPLAARWVFGAPEEVGWRVLWWVGVVIVGLTIFGLSAVLCWVLGNIAASPFYDVLAGMVEREVLGIEDDEAFSWSRVLGDAWISVKHSAAWLAMWLAVVVPLVLVNLIPGVGSVLYAIGSFVATAFFVARELMDVPLSRRRTTFREKLAYLRANRGPVMGAGAITAVFLMVPLANLIVMPVAVVGASLMFCHLELEGRGIEAGVRSVTP